MKDVYWALGVATVGAVIYHTGQKAIAADANPMLLLIGVYGIAVVLALMAFPFFRAPTQSDSVRHMLSWPVVAVGIGVILIEGGFLMAYRAGGSLQWSGVAVNGLAAVVLVPIAVIVFREQFSATRIVGVVVTLVGMFLMARK
jgi:drug/metabolite transporter (DMT)-like permease